MRNEHAASVRYWAELRRKAVALPLIGHTHIDPVTGDTVRPITRESARRTIYPPAVPCPDCIGYPCECGTAGEGC